MTGDDDPPLPPPPPDRPATRRYGWVIGAIGVIAIAYITVNTLRTDGPGATGLAAGDRMPAFAAPLALSRLDGDANVATRTGQGQAGNRPACQVRGPDILNICQLAAGHPVVLVFHFDRSGKVCQDQLDAVERVRLRHPDVRFAAVSIRGDRAALRRLIRTRRWGFPVGYDRDGQVANLYGVGVCPTVTFARPGRVVAATTVGLLDEGELDARVGALERASGRRTP